MATVTRREFWDRLELALYGSTWNTFSTQTALLIDALYDDLVARPAQAPVTRERELLRELAALVRGECPSLLNEDSGGDVRLSMAIDDALAAPPAAEELPRCDTCGRPWTKKVSAISGRIVCRACAAQAPPASDPPRLGCESPSNCDPKLDLCTHCQARTAPNGLTPPSWITARQSDPPGLVDVVRAWQEARTARMELFKKWERDEYRPAPFDEVSSISFRMDEATKALDAYPLPASPQAKED